MAQEKREYERKAMRGPARLSLPGTKPVMVRTVDISFGGLLVVADVNIPVRQTVKIEFNILIRKSNVYTALVLNAGIVYSAFSNDEGGFKLGLQFGDLPDKYKLLILQYVGAKKAEKPVESPKSDAENPLLDSLEES